VEKTLADCSNSEIKLAWISFWKPLNSIEKEKTDLTKLVKYGKICRVDRVMMPYLEVHP
jgi:hypothetical protein